jgi:hypothetical protein
MKTVISPDSLPEPPCAGIRFEVDIERIDNADLRAGEKAMSTSGKVTVERDGRTYAATYTVEGDMVHVKTHTETRSVALSGKKPEDIARRELKEIVEASRRH